MKAPRGSGWLLSCACAFLIGGIAMSLGSNSGSGSGYTLWYLNQLGEHEKNHLVIDDTGVVSAEIGYAQTGTVPRHLGWYGLEIGHQDAELVEIGGLVRRQSLVSGPDLSHEAYPGMRGKMFKIELDGASALHSIDIDQPMPEALRELEARLEHLLARVAEAPRRTFAMDVSFAPPAIRAGDELKITAALSCIGAFACEIRNPLSAENAGMATLSLNFWRDKQGPGGAEELEFESSLALDQQEFLVGERKALKTTDPWIRIPAGETLLTWTTLRFGKMAPGIVAVEPIYYAAPISDEEGEAHGDLVVGEYHAPLQRVTVLER